MNQTLTNFRKAVSDSPDLQEKIRGRLMEDVVSGRSVANSLTSSLVVLGKENGYEFSQDELNDSWTQLQESDEGSLTEFELNVVAGGGMVTGDCT